jgi:hypothetical protein|tara:strand:- start:693 stop:1187 length:495 start_codon:yes stop_codon:yes gene_type:complete
MFESITQSFNQTSLSPVSWNDMYIYFIFIVLLVIFLYLMNQFFFYQLKAAKEYSRDFYNNNLSNFFSIEGFENISPSKIDETIVKKFEEKNKELKDALRIDKYRDTYENCIFAMEENINLKILEKLLSSDKNLNNKTISSINELQEFKKSLASSLKFMDHSNDD